MIKVNNVIKEMETLAPICLKEDFDNVGLMVGDRNKEVKKVLLALDCTLKVIEEAKDEIKCKIQDYLDNTEYE